MKELQVPEQELLWVSYEKDGKVLYTITSDKHRETYYLNAVDSKGKMKRTRYKADNPLELSERVFKLM